MKPGKAGVVGAGAVEMGWNGTGGDKTGQDGWEECSTRDHQTVHTYLMTPVHSLTQTHDQPLESEREAPRRAQATICRPPSVPPISTPTSVSTTSTPSPLPLRQQPALATFSRFISLFTHLPLLLISSSTLRPLHITRVHHFAQAMPMLLTELSRYSSSRSSHSTLPPHNLRSLR